jgi:hypothetical protein
MDGVMRDAERLTVGNWRSKGKDRDGWRRLLESAKESEIGGARARTEMVGGDFLSRPRSQKLEEQGQG